MSLRRSRRRPALSIAVFVTIAALCAPARVDAAEAPALHAEAEAALARGDAAGAAALLEQAIAADPAYWPSLCRLGEIHLAGGRLAEAEPLLRKATGINPQHGPCLSRFAQVLLMTGREAEAEDPLRRAADLMPSDAGVLFNLARLYETTERPAEAIEAYRRHLAVAADPKRAASARLRLARLLIAQHRLEEAIPEYRQYLQDIPDRHEVRNELAVTLSAASRYTEALAEYERVFAAGKGDADGLARAGSICLLIPDAPRAVGYLERAVQADPGSMPARLALGTALGQAGDHARAVEVLAAAAADEPDNERVHYMLAQSLLKLGRKEEARQAMQKHQQLHERLMKERMSKQEPAGHP